MQINSIKTDLFKEGDSLVDFIKYHVPILNEGDILVVTSKVVALSENRIRKIEDKEQVIISEAKKVIKTPWADLTLTDRGWEINAGVDESNVQSGLVMLPEDPFLSAELLWRNLKLYYKLNNLGILVTDTRSVPLRVGTVGRAIGFAGFLPIRNYIDKEDLYGRKSRVTVSNLADSLSASAVMEMGEGDEMTPLALIKDAKVLFTNDPPDTPNKNLDLAPEEDIFRFLYKDII